jgi:formylmethanofuran dehydrogenase subunit B
VSTVAITCPFCGLVCDDLALSESGIDTRGCSLAAAGFRRGDVARRPHSVAGIPADLATATAEAARLLRAARMPLFHGLAVDVHGVRALLALADRAGAAVDHLASAPLLANAAVARASGWVTATFAEIANRADVILLVGGDPARTFPRFHERLVRNPMPLYRAGPPLVAYLGPAETAPPADAATLHAHVLQSRLLDALGVLAVRLQGRQPSAAPDLPDDLLARIAERLAAARYGAIVWHPASFAPAGSELAIERLAAILRHLNVKTRCVGLPLGGTGNGVGAMQAALWQTGWPLRLGFGDGTPRHDPWRFDARRLLASGEADLLLWATTLVADAPPATDRPLIAIVSDDVVLEKPADVEIRVGIPAIDHAGAVFRSDTVIALPLQATRPSDQPSVGDAVQAILARWEATP